MQYQTYPTSQSRKNCLRLQFRKSPRNDKSGTLVPKGKAKFSNFGSNHFFSRIEPFWVILSKKNFFEKMVEKWLSLEAWWPLWRKKNRKSQKTLFSRIGPFWVIWSKKKIFRKISTDYGSTAKIVSFEEIFFGTWNFQEMFLTILSTISVSFSFVQRPAGRVQKVG